LGGSGRVREVRGLGGSRGLCGEADGTAVGRSMVDGGSLDTVLVVAVFARGIVGRTGKGAFLVVGALVVFRVLVVFFFFFFFFLCPCHLPLSSSCVLGHASPKGHHLLHGAPPPRASSTGRVFKNLSTDYFADQDEFLNVGGP
jgi:hypothetical protein